MQPSLKALLKVTRMMSESFNGKIMRNQGVMCRMADTKPSGMCNRIGSEVKMTYEWKMNLELFIFF